MTVHCHPTASLPLHLPSTPACFPAHAGYPQGPPYKFITNTFQKVLSVSRKDVRTDTEVNKEWLVMCLKTAQDKL